MSEIWSRPRNRSVGRSGVPNLTTRQFFPIFYVTCHRRPFKHANKSDDFRKSSNRRKLVCIFSLKGFTVILKRANSSTLVDLFMPFRIVVIYVKKGRVFSQSAFHLSSPIIRVQQQQSSYLDGRRALCRLHLDGSFCSGHLSDLKSSVSRPEVAKRDPRHVT